MNPPAVCSAEMEIDTARLPGVSVADMKLAWLARTTLASVMGSPANSGARTTALSTALFMSGCTSRVTKAGASADFGQACQRTSLTVSGRPASTSLAATRTSVVA